MARSLAKSNVSRMGTCAPSLGRAASHVGRVRTVWFPHKDEREWLGAISKSCCRLSFKRIWWRGEGMVEEVLNRSLEMKIMVHLLEQCRFELCSSTYTQIFFSLNTYHNVTHSVVVEPQLWEQTVNSSVNFSHPNRLIVQGSTITDI